MPPRLPIAAEVGRSPGMLTRHRLQCSQISRPFCSGPDPKAPVASVCVVGSHCPQGQPSTAGKGVSGQTPQPPALGGILLSCVLWVPLRAPVEWNTVCTTARAGSEKHWGVFSCPILLSQLPLGNSFHISNLYSTLVSGSAFRAPEMISVEPGALRFLCTSGFPDTEVPGTIY